MALLKDHLIFHYKMNDDDATPTVVDETGNYDATYKDAGGDLNTDTGASTGKIKGALDFDGADEYIDFGDIVLVGEFSISMWINPDSITYRTLLGDADNEDWLRINNAAILGIKINNIGKTYTHGHTFTTGEWQHIVITRNSSNNISVYRNGVKPTATRNVSGTFTPKYIGQENTSYFFDGLIDNVMLFNKELTSLEIKSLYNNGAGRETMPTGIKLNRTGYGFSSRQEM